MFKWACKFFQTHCCDVDRTAAEVRKHVQRNVDSSEKLASAINEFLTSYDERKSNEITIHTRRIGDKSDC